MSDTMKRLLSIAGLALLGIALAVGVTMAVASLSSQSIGISEEPIEAGEELAVPARTTPPAATHTQPRTQTTPTTTPRTTPAPPPVTTDDRDSGDDDRSDSNSGSDDDGGGDDDSGRGRGRGRGDDDD